MNLYHVLPFAQKKIKNWWLSYTELIFVYIFALSGTGICFGTNQYLRSTIIEVSTDNILMNILKKELQKHIYQLFHIILEYSHEFCGLLYSLFTLIPKS